jgi:uncharacterized protein YprB with RNaseH-like and TPR domain
LINKILLKKLKAKIMKAQVISDFNWNLDSKHIKILDNYETPKNTILGKNNLLFPSKITNVFWVLTSDLSDSNTTKKSAINTSSIKIKSGKWLLYINIEELDLTWQKIKKATEEGLLGTYSKAATKRQNPNAVSENEKVICIYTYDWSDKKDVFRIEKALREIGIYQTLYYKADIDTLNGKYKNKGDSHISKYISKSVVNTENDKLTNLCGIGFEKSKILNKIGIFNLDDLINFDLSKKLNNVGITNEYIDKLKIFALSKKENKVYKLSEYQFPTGQNLFFDIETDYYSINSEKKIWSVAIYVDNKIKHFYAESWEEEKNMLSDFLIFLKLHQQYNIISYSQFDVSTLTFALKRYNLDSEFFINMNHFDLFEILKKNYVLPLKSYGVKEVGNYFGYKFKNQNINGLLVAMQYERIQGKGKRISKIFLEYIYDDVKVMSQIVEKIKIENDFILIDNFTKEIHSKPIAKINNEIRKVKSTELNLQNQFIEDNKISALGFNCPRCRSKNFIEISEFHYKCQDCNKGNLKLSKNRNGKIDYMLY